MKPPRRELQRPLVALISDGATKSAACRALGINPRTPTRWVERDSTFAESYAAARIEQAHSLADRAIEISNEAVEPGDMVAVQRNRLRVDTIKWLCSKIAPRLYGDRVVAEVKTRAPVILLPLLDGSPDKAPDVFQAINAAGSTVVRRNNDRFEALESAGNRANTNLINAPG